MAISFAQAMEAVRYEASKNWRNTEPIFVPEWGSESENYWGVEVGTAKYYIDHDPGYMPIDNIAYLVNKCTGEVVVKTVVDNLDWFADQNFRDFGNIPAFFK